MLTIFLRGLYVWKCIACAWIIRFNINISVLPRSTYVLYNASFIISESLDQPGLINTRRGLRVAKTIFRKGNWYGNFSFQKARFIKKL